MQSDEANFMTWNRIQPQTEEILQSVGYLNLFLNPIIFLTSIVGFLAYFEYFYLEPILAVRLLEVDVAEWLIGIFFWIQGVSYTIASLCTSYISEMLGKKRTIWISMLLWGFIHFMIGPSNFLPNNVIITKLK